MNDKEIETEIQEKGLTAPRVTLMDVENNIRSEYYFTGVEAVDWGAGNLLDYHDTEALKLLTFCILILQNGFTVTGESACVSAENFDAELGRKVAKQKAMDKVWMLMGYSLKKSLSEES